MNAAKNKGFSLVELIIVIAIIAVLSAVLAPQFISFLEDSRESNDVVIADMLMQATSLAISDPSVNIPAGHDILVGWQTTHNGDSVDAALVGTVPTYFGLYDRANDSISGALASGGAIADTNANDARVFIVGILGQLANVGGNGQYRIPDAESNIGGSNIFSFRMNAETGEVILVNTTDNWNTITDWNDDTNPWISQLGVK